MNTFVYFGQAPYGGAIKIGCSHMPKHRLDAISESLPFELVLIGSFRGGRFRERFVQCWFHSSHIRGEWFGQTPEIWRWAIEAQGTNDIMLVPPEPPAKFLTDTERLKELMSRYGLSLSDVARVSRVNESSVRTAFGKPFISSLLLTAAVRSAVLRINGRVPSSWDHLRYRGEVPPEKDKKKRRISMDFPQAQTSVPAP